MQFLTSKMSSVHQDPFECCESLGLGACVKRFAIIVVLLSLFLRSDFVQAQTTLDNEKATADKAKEKEAKETAELERSFQRQIEPFFKIHCTNCHDADTMESGIRLDKLTGLMEDRQLALWKGIAGQLIDEAMPPEDELQPTAAQREQVVQWIENAIATARRRGQEKNGSARRLTVAQYQNTLRDLLGIEDDFTELLPADGVSKDGFLNNGQTLHLSPLLVEAYFDIAEKALDRCIVDESSRPTIQNFRMDLGEAINPKPFPEQLILGANSHLLDNDDFVVTQITPEKSFDFDPFRMRTKYEFIEGYQGNNTVRGWRKYDSIYHAVFACVRGTEGYPNGNPYRVVPEGLLLRPAIPSSELFGQSSTYGPKANFKVSLRELPDHGKFRIIVKAARYDDGLLLNRGTPTGDVYAKPGNGFPITADLFESPNSQVIVTDPGVYQVDVHFWPTIKPEPLSLQLGARHFSGRLHPIDKSPDQTEQASAFLLVRLPAGRLNVIADYGNGRHLARIVFTKLPPGCEPAQRFQVFENRSPIMGVHVGLRRDCGSTLSPVAKPQYVSHGELRSYVYEGAISNFPSPDVEKDNVNYLAGVREIGVRSEFTDGRDMPRLLVRSVEFEGPFFETWPPKSHRNIFVESDHEKRSKEYASEVIGLFASRAFRRPVTAGEHASLMRVWENSFSESGDFQRSVKDSLLVALTSPQFLFLIENSETPDAEKLHPLELASKLSYFLWNSAPDARLLNLANTKNLYESIDVEIDRMIRDARFEQFTNEFISQWLSLEKIDIVEIDQNRFPKLTRDTKSQLRNESIEFLNFLIQQNLSIRNVIQSDFILANEVVANYYNLSERVESGLAFVAVQHDSPSLGGVLSQAGIMAALSDGRESNPVKRGAWLARKIIAEPPDDPPPNIPALPTGDDASLSLREKLERHRNQKGCVKCHEGIDPWGLPLEQFDASGLYRENVESKSALPDETQVAGVNELKTYLANDRLDQIAFSFLKHLATYANGRSLNFNEIETLKVESLELKTTDYRMQDLIRFVVKSKLFLEK